MHTSHIITSRNVQLVFLSSFLITPQPFGEYPRPPPGIFILYTKSQKCQDNKANICAVSDSPPPLILQSNLPATL